jgi:hypothetical protein
LILSGFHLESFEGNFHERMGGVSQFIEASRTQSAALSSELHTLLAAVSLGVPPDEFPMPRYMPMRVYLKEGSRESLRPVTNHAQRFAAALRFELAVTAGNRSEGGYPMVRLNSAKRICTAT